MLHPRRCQLRAPIFRQDCRRGQRSLPIRRNRHLHHHTRRKLTRRSFPHESCRSVQSEASGVVRPQQQQLLFLHREHRVRRDQPAGHLVTRRRPCLSRPGPLLPRSKLRPPEVRRSSPMEWVVVVSKVAIAGYAEIGADPTRWQLSFPGIHCLELTQWAILPGGCVMHFPRTTTRRGPSLLGATTTFPMTPFHSSTTTCDIILSKTPSSAEWLSAKVMPRFTWRLPSVQV